MLCAYLFEHNSDWDQGIPFLLFAVRDSAQESLGFSPFELVFGHEVRGPLNLLRDRILGNADSKTNLRTYVTEMKERPEGAREMAQNHLKVSQTHMKVSYDKRGRDHQFNVDDQV